MTVICDKCGLTIGAVTLLPLEHVCPAEVARSVRELENLIADHVPRQTGVHGLTAGATADRLKAIEDRLANQVSLFFALDNNQDRQHDRLEVLQGEVAMLRRLLAHVLALPAVGLTLPDELKAQAAVLARVQEE